MGESEELPPAGHPKEKVFGIVSGVGWACSSQIQAMLLRRGFDLSPVAWNIWDGANVATLVGCIGISLHLLYSYGIERGWPKPRVYGSVSFAVAILLVMLVGFYNIGLIRRPGITSIQANLNLVRPTLEKSAPTPSPKPQVDRGTNKNRVPDDATRKLPPQAEKLRDIPQEQTRNLPTPGPFSPTEFDLNEAKATLGALRRSYWLNEMQRRGLKADEVAGLVPPPEEWMNSRLEAMGRPYRVKLNGVLFNIIPTVSSVVPGDTSLRDQR